MKRVQLEVLKDHGSRVSDKGYVGGSEGSWKSCVWRRVQLSRL